MRPRKSNALMIKIENLAKSFGAKRAVDGISFTVERGEVVGFLGPNGSGKSTTMRMITGYYAPDGGKVSVGGYDVVESPLEAKRLIGYLPENAAAYTDMTVRGFLEFAAALRGLSGDAKNKAVVFSTHILEEVDASCTRAIIIDRGKIVAQGTPDELGRPLDEVFRRLTIPDTAAK